MPKIPHISFVTIKPAKDQKRDTLCRHVTIFNSMTYPEYNTRPMTYEEIDAEYVGQLACYFAHQKKVNFNKNGNPVKLNTALGYMSAFKSDIQDRFISKPCPLAMTGHLWKKCLSDISAAKVAYARAHGERVVNPHEMATDEDKTALGAACIWNNDLESAKFHHVINKMYHAAGR